jgi:glucose-6-phosphate 1-dehydrogenase
VLGQYLAAEDGSEPSYVDDPTVPRDSLTATFATLILRIKNPRWDGVPFILKAGKALDERKAEIRIQFKKAPGAEGMFGGQHIPSNELVLRLQPNEAIYMKTNVKSPGLKTIPVASELNLSYEERYVNSEIFDAYTRLILEVIRGRQATFVRDDELKAAWAIFTPLLHQIEKEKIRPILYEYGSRGPRESDKLIERAGYQYHGGGYKRERLKSMSGRKMNVCLVWWALSLLRIVLRLLHER